MLSKVARCMAATASILSTGVLAQTEATAQSRQSYTPFYAFSNYFNSGFYQGTGGQLTVINIPLKFEPKQEGRNVYRIRLPLSFGFTDFQIDTSGVRIPDSVATATITAGIEFDHWTSDDFMLRPFIDVGFARNFSGNANSVVYAAGLSSFYYFHAADEKQVLVSRFQRASYRTEETLAVDGFSSLDTGIDWTLPFRYEMFDKPMFMTVYGRIGWYFLDQTNVDDLEGFPSVLDAQEVGFTLGWVKPLDLVLFDLDRIGLGYRTGDGLTAWRIVFGFPLE